MNAKQNPLTFFSYKSDQKYEVVICTFRGIDEIDKILIKTCIEACITTPFDQNRYIIAPSNNGKGVFIEGQMKDFVQDTRKVIRAKLSYQIITQEETWKDVYCATPTCIPKALGTFAVDVYVRTK
jgi:hypothetical protein